MTEFERKVYAVVARIPLGECRSYGWVAARAGKPRASRAVGRALNRNPFPLLIPCHRVIRCDGQPGGFRWGGAKKKQKLLELEKDLAAWLKTSR